MYSTYIVNFELTTDRSQEVRKVQRTKNSIKRINKKEQCDDLVFDKFQLNKIVNKWNSIFEC